jgi:hypothetical protein
VVKKPAARKRATEGKESLLAWFVENFKSKPPASWPAYRLEENKTRYIQLGVQPEYLYGKARKQYWTDLVTSILEGEATPPKSWTVAKLMAYVEYYEQYGDRPRNRKDLDNFLQHGVRLEKTKKSRSYLFNKKGKVGVEDDDIRFQHAPGKYTIN